MFCADDSLCNISHFFIALYSIRGSVERVLTMYMSSDIISNINIMMMIIYYSSSIIVRDTQAFSSFGSVIYNSLVSLLLPLVFCKQILYNFIKKQH